MRFENALDNLPFAQPETILTFTRFFWFCPAPVNDCLSRRGVTFVAPQCLSILQSGNTREARRRKPDGRSEQPVNWELLMRCPTECRVHSKVTVLRNLTNCIDAVKTVSFYSRPAEGQRSLRIPPSKGVPPHDMTRSDIRQNSCDLTPT